METRQMILFFQLLFPLCLYNSFSKYSKFNFIWSPISSILVIKIPQILVKSYQFRQLIILFQKADTLGLPKNLCYVFAHPPSQIPIFLGASSWTKLLISDFFKKIESTSNLGIKIEQWLPNQAMVNLVLSSKLLSRVKPVYRTNSTYENSSVEVQINHT